MELNNFVYLLYALIEDEQYCIISIKLQLNTIYYKFEIIQFNKSIKNKFNIKLLEYNCINNYIQAV